MVLKNAVQPGYNTSLMGVLHAAATCYGMALDAATVFGGTGHAFLINIHEELCPSSPYVWDHEPVHRLATNLGLRIKELGFYDSNTSIEHRPQLEERIRELLDNGIVCGVVNMDHQLIYGYEEARLLLAEPWGELPQTPSALSSETWAEFGDEMHAVFYCVEQTDAADARTTAREALRFAIDVSRHPERWAEPKYGMGPNAYRNWIDAIRTGHGTGHGAWWNAVVWSECRAEAASYLRGLVDSGQAATDAARGAFMGASEQYRRISLELKRVAEPELPVDEKVAALEAARDEETRVTEALDAFVDLLED